MKVPSFLWRWHRRRLTTLPVGVSCTLSGSFLGSASASGQTARRKANTRTQALYPGNLRRGKRNKNYRTASNGLRFAKRVNRYSKRALPAGDQIRKWDGLKRANNRATKNGKLQWVCTVCACFHTRCAWRECWNMRMCQSRFAAVAFCIRKTELPKLMDCQGAISLARKMWASFSEANVKSSRFVRGGDRSWKGNEQRSANVFIVTLITWILIDFLNVFF